MTWSRAHLDSNARTSRTSYSVLATGAAVLGMVGLIGCGSDRTPGIDNGQGAGGFPNDDGGTVACEEGASKSCTVTLSEHNGVVSCYEGIQLCQGGFFGPCQDGTVVERHRSSSSGMKVMSLSDAGTCEDNPCDPSCQAFDEVPDAGLSLEGGANGPEWVTAPLDVLESSSPPGLFGKGFNEPCFSNMDCQFDQYCYQPNTAAACAHSKCSTGVGLASACDPCVTAVCAKMPACCNTTAAGTCTPSGSACSATTTCCAGLDCVNDVCTAPGAPTPTNLWVDDFATNKGWAYGTEWSRGVALSSWGHDAGYADPATDATATADDMIAGAVRGGNVTTSMHGYYYLTSPVIDTSASQGTLTLSYKRWLNSDYAPWMNNHVEIFNGSTWTTIWESGGYPVTDNSWQTVTHDITAYKSAGMRFRFGHNVDYPSGVYRMSGWNLDDVAIIHNPLVAGACVAAGGSCAGGKSCCTSSACVSGVCASPNGSWSAACIDKVGEVCGSFCSKTGSCSHDICTAGGPLSSACDSCVASICALDSSCCNSSWDNYCVAKVGSVCNKNCAAPAGECRQYNPDETNPYCTALPDLTAGVPCGMTVPICNRGAATVPANSTSFFYFSGLSSNDSTFTTCNVSTPLQNTAKRCPITVEIPPGECRSITCAQLGNNGGIVVNPSAISSYPTYAPIAECSCQNNWSLFKKPGQNDPPCGAPACLSSSVEATIPTVNMYIMFDKSGSMSGTRWNLTTAALRGFIRDPASAGLRVALRFFPGTVSGSECGGYTCTDNGCKTPEVTLGALLAAQGTDVACGSMPSNCATAADPQECRIVKAIRCNSASGWTPLLPALGGSTSYMGDHAWNYPLERSVVVLVTDGWPEGDSSYPANCRSPADSNFITKAQTAFNDYGVVTYTVNVVGGKASLMQAIATAGHGQYFYVSDANASAELVAALNQIRANSVSCDLLLDSTQGLDPTQVSVTFTDGNNVTSDFLKLAAGESCGTQNNKWYFDDEANPTKITLCPATCARVRADINSKIELEVGCPTSFQPEDFVYTYKGECPPGSSVQWGQLVWTATTPGNSTVTFKARTSNDPATFTVPPAPGELKTLGVAHDDVAPYVVDTQVCSVSGPTPDCPVDVYDRLGLPAASYSNLELTISLLPSTTGAAQAPMLEDWNLTYSCPQTE